jgi:hypothetical protein
MNLLRASVRVVMFVDIRGKVLFRQKGISNEGKNQVEILLSDLSSGIYFVMFWTEGDKVIPLRLVVE